MAFETRHDRGHNWGPNLVQMTKAEMIYRESQWKGESLSGEYRAGSYSHGHYCFWPIRTDSFLSDKH